MTWVRRLRLALVIISVVVLQTTLFSDRLRVFGVMPDIGLVLTVAVAYNRVPELGAAFGFAAGLRHRLLPDTPVGLSALSFALVGYGVGVVQSGLVRPSLLASLPAHGASRRASLGGALFVASAPSRDRTNCSRVAQRRRSSSIAGVYDALLALASRSAIAAVAATREPIAAGRSA